MRRRRTSTDVDDTTRVKTVLLCRIFRQSEQPKSDCPKVVGKSDEIQMTGTSTGTADRPQNGPRTAPALQEKTGPPEVGVSGT